MRSSIPVTKSVVKNLVSFHETLNPKLWDNETLDFKVRIHLLKTASEFISFIDIENLVVKDIIIIGSNCGYNYTSYSDLDLHLLVEYNTQDYDIVDNLFLTKKELWKQTHNITIHHIPVEIYVEDYNNFDGGNASFSLVTDEWIKRPSKKEPKIDSSEVIMKTEEYCAKIERVISDNPDSAEIEELISSLKRLRQNGLENGGEFSIENLVFKAIRNLGFVEFLWDLKSHLENKELSLK